jgi:hypothetical protein
MSNPTRNEHDLPRTQLSDEIKVRVEGHLKITQYENEEDTKGVVLLDKRNAIHPEHMSILIARSVAHRSNGPLYSMYFGSGGATVDPLGDITYATPNTSGSADLNTPTYFEVIDDNNGAPSGNSMTVRHINGTLFSDVEIRCVLSKNEPFTQPAFDSLSGQNINTTAFVFSEIGLKTQDDLLITHVVFSPIMKSSNRIIEAVYVLRFRMFV